MPACWPLSCRCAARRRGQLTAASCGPLPAAVPSRPDAFVAYLDERRPAGLQLAAGPGQPAGQHVLGRHRAASPGIGSLRLPAQVAEDWKQRLAFRTDLKAAGFHAPTGWACWCRCGPSTSTSPCGRWKTRAGFRGRCPARSARATSPASPRRKNRSRPGCTSGIRERLPRLPDLLAAAQSHHADQAELLAAAEVAAIGQPLSMPGRRYRRISREQDRARGGCSTGSR